MAETIVETKACKYCWASFTITDKDLEFYDKISPVFWWKKYSIPSPTLCPDCRQQRRLARRNERKLYKRTCDASGKPIISIFSPDKPYKVYDQRIWRSDNRNDMDYGRSFDFDKDFFQQFEELMITMPKISLINKWSENSEYTNDANNNKDCYLCFWVDESQNVYHSTLWISNKNCVDCYWLWESENCYECKDCTRCFNVFFSDSCNDISDCFWCSKCYNCSYCFWCKSLENKKFNIFNKQYTKEEYFSRINEISWTNSLDAVLEKIKQFHLTICNKNLDIELSENCLGDFIKNSRNVYLSYNIWKSENLKYCYNAFDIKDCYDTYMVSYGSALLYECQTIIWTSYRSGFCSFTNNGIKDCYYCIDCTNLENCFACAGLKNKQYCIFNKQYTKEEYEALAPKIIEHMQRSPAKDGTGWQRWEFFPAKLSPFGYNETVAQESYPLSKEDALKQWFNRSDYDVPSPNVDKMLKASELPSIQEVTDDILQQAILCEVTGKPFRIVKPELEFYRKYNLPLPTKHPDQRHLERMQTRNPRKLRERKCAKCWTDIKTTYSPERPEIVYCESCYSKEIYW